MILPSTVLVNFYFLAYMSKGRYVDLYLNYYILLDKEVIAKIYSV